MSSIKRDSEQELKTKGSKIPKLAVQINENKVDPLFDPKNKSNKIFPTKFNDINAFYQRAIKSFWIADEVDLTDDIKEWKQLPEKVQNFLKYVFSFFAQSDFIVNDNIDTFMDEVTILEARFFYNYQKAIEDIHSTMYQRILVAFFGENKEEYDKCMNAVAEIPVIKAKADWVKRWLINGSNTEKIVIGSIVERIFFSGNFCAIFYVGKEGKMKGVVHKNMLIATDEALHGDFGCLMYRKYINNKLPRERIIRMIVEAVDVENDYIKEALPFDLPGMNARLMLIYIQFIADDLAMNLIGEKIFDVENPFPWMILQNVYSKHNHFETNGSYSAVGSGSSVVSKDSGAPIEDWNDF